MTSYLAGGLQAIVAAGLAPLLVGFIRWLKARLQGRLGAPPWQPYYEISKLFGKEAVVSHTASWIFKATPFVVFGSSVVVASFVPLVLAPLGTWRSGTCSLWCISCCSARFFLRSPVWIPARLSGAWGRRAR